MHLLVQFGVRCHVLLGLVWVLNAVRSEALVLHFSSPSSPLKVNTNETLVLPSFFITEQRRQHHNKHNTITCTHRYKHNDTHINIKDRWQLHSFHRRRHLHSQTTDASDMYRRCGGGASDAQRLRRLFLHLLLFSSEVHVTEPSRRGQVVVVWPATESNTQVTTKQTKPEP